MYVFTKCILFPFILYYITLIRFDDWSCPDFVTGPLFSYHLYVCTVHVCIYLIMVTPSLYYNLISLSLDVVSCLSFV